MAKNLATLLGNDHPLFAHNLKELETASGGSGIDARLVGDIIEKAHGIMRELGLDPVDTTASELYNALKESVKKQSARGLLHDSTYSILEIEGTLVSFNLFDVIENAHHDVPIGDGMVSHAQRNLRREIVKRYAEHERTHDVHVHEVAAQSGIKQEGDDEYMHYDEALTNGAPSGSNAPRVLAIGDIFTDAFIKLNEDVARVETDESGEKRISLPLGTKPPYDQVDIVQAVGPAPNAAVAIARLGLNVDLDSFIGDDQVGKEALEYLKSEHIGTENMLVQEGIKTSYYFVLRYGAERTILVKNEQFNYRWVEPLKKPEWVYLALISDASWQFHEDLLSYLEANPDIKLAFQPGTFHFKWGVEKLAKIYQRSHILVLNREEAVDVTGRSYDSIRGLAEGLHELGPKKVVITDGPNGSYASFDGKLVTIPNYPDPAAPVDRTGAGDAFASTIVAALAKGETMEDAIRWAPVNSASVVQQLGAQKGLLTSAELNDWLSKAPDWYVVSEYND